MVRSTALALVAATMLSGTVFAQTATTATDPAPAAPITGSAASGTHFITEQKTGEFRASKFIGLTVYGADNQKIGDINEILMDANGAAKVVVIGVGGFLGIGEKNVGVPFASLEWVTAPKPGNTASNAPTGTGVGAAGTSPTASPIVTGSITPARSPEETAAYNGYPDHAVLRMTKADLQSAPDFKYYAQTQANVPATKP